MRAAGDKALRAWLAVLACIALISIFSSEGFSQPATSRYVEPLVLELFPWFGQDQVNLVHLYVRKGAHITEYALLALLCFRALRLTASLRVLHACGFALALVLAVASADELRQFFLPSRAGSPWDVMLNLLGGVLGLALILALYRVRGVAPPLPPGPDSGR